MEYFYLDGSQRPIGPVSRQDLAQLKKTGVVTNHTLIATEGAAAWQYLGVIDESLTGIRSRGKAWAFIALVFFIVMAAGTLYTLRSRIPPLLSSAKAATENVLAPAPADDAQPPLPDVSKTEVGIIEHELGEWYELGLALGEETAQAWDELGRTGIPDAGQMAQILSNFGADKADIPPDAFELTLQGYRDGATGRPARFKPASTQTRSILPASLSSYSVSSFGTNRSPVAADSPRPRSNSSLENVIACTVKIQASSPDHRALGTGFFIAPGLVLTNRHVIEKATSMILHTQDQKQYDAMLVAKSTDMDIAVLRISFEGHPVLSLRDSDAVRVGDEVTAVGFPLYEDLSATATFGRISSTDRYIGSNPCFQIDVSINKGNSGGPLVDAQGHVIGINTFSFPKTKADRFNFSIKMNDVRQWMKEQEVPLAE